MAKKTNADHATDELKKKVSVQTEKMRPKSPEERIAEDREETAKDDFEVTVEQRGIPNGDHLVEITKVSLFERIETKFGIDDFVVWNVEVIEGEPDEGKQDSIWHSKKMSERSNLGKMFIQYMGRDKFFRAVGTSIKPRMLVGSVWRVNFSDGKGVFDHFVRHTKGVHELDELPF